MTVLDTNLTSLFVIASLRSNPEYCHYMQNKIPCVYIMASRRNGTLYTGVTSNLITRVQQHKNNAVEGFTKKYNVHTLVYYEVAEGIYAAIAREKQIKGSSRKNKIALIEAKNPTWRDLFGDL